jgi:hypothetical protein
MGFYESFTFLLSYLGILLLGSGILLSLLGIAVALFAILTILPRLDSGSPAGRMFTLLLIFLATHSYLSSLAYGSLPTWWSLYWLGGLLAGLVLQWLRLDRPLPPYPYHLGIASSGLLWWLSWVTSQAVLLMGNQGQALAAPLLTVVTGWFIGFTAGNLLRQLRQRALRQGLP